MLLHRMQDRGQPITVRLRMSARTLPDAPSRNLVAEIRGREKPDEVVVIGGHIDSWDVGQGAMDDAGGVVAAWEAVRLMKKLGLRPRRTVRVVGWTNEENGTKGGVTYRATHAADVDKHVFALESDNGVFRPLGIAVVGTDSAIAMLRRIAPLLKAIGADSVDTPDKLDPHEVALCVATMAVYAYVLAEMPETLPRTPVTPATH
jgi:carboxypeptidase Q